MGVRRDFLVAAAAVVAVANRRESRRKVNNPKKMMGGVVGGRFGLRRRVGRIAGSGLESHRLDCRRRLSRVLGVGGGVGRWDARVVGIGVLGGRMVQVFVEVERVEGQIGGMRDILRRMEVVAVDIGRGVGQRLIGEVFDRMMFDSAVGEMPLDREGELGEAVETAEVGIETTLGHWVVVNLVEDCRIFVEGSPERVELPHNQMVVDPPAHIELAAVVPLTAQVALRNPF